MAEKTADIGDNSERLEALIIAHAKYIRDQDAVIEGHQGQVRAAKLVRKGMVAAFTSETGLPIELLKEALGKGQTTRVDLQLRENQRRFIFRALAIPVASETTDIETLAARDEAFWNRHGYAQGVKDLPATHPPGIPAEFIQAWLRGHAAGCERLSWAQAEQQGTAPERKVPVAETEKEPEAVH